MPATPGRETGDLTEIEAGKAVYTGRGPGSTRAKSWRRKAGRCKILTQEIQLSGISLPILKFLLQEHLLELLIEGLSTFISLTYETVFSCFAW